MTISIAILKVLSAYPEGRASFASLKADLEILATLEWHARIRALAARAGTIGLFSSKLATRDATGWTITDAGREFLERLESGAQLALSQPFERPVLRVVASKPVAKKSPGSKAVQLKVVA